MIAYTTSKSDKELTAILELQKVNLPQNLTESERNSQGFLTVSHTLEDLKKLNEYENHLIIKDGEQVVGYVLAMTKRSRNGIPVLLPMFELFDRVSYKGKLISAYNYLVVGQVCIDKDYRGLGLLDNGYAAYKACFKDRYDFAITEISTNNTRSINAHKRIGFLELHRFVETNNTEWSVVIWDWNK